MNRQELIDEYKKKLAEVRAEKATCIAAEHQCLGAIGALEELAKQEALPKRGNLADANGQTPELAAGIPD